MRFSTSVLLKTLIGTKGEGNKSKNKQEGLHQTKKLLHSEGRHEESKQKGTGTLRTGEPGVPNYI